MKRKHPRKASFFSSWRLTCGLLVCMLSIPALPVSGQIRELIEQFAADEESLRFKYRNQTSPTTMKRMVDFYSLWKTRANQIDFEGLTQDQKIDAVLLKNYAVKRESEFTTKTEKDQVVSRVVPFLAPLYKMLDDHEATRLTDSKRVAEIMEKVSEDIDKFNRATLNYFEGNEKVILDARKKISHILQSLAEYNRFHDRYDPVYSWWVSQPYDKLQKKLSLFSDELKREVYGESANTDKIVGNPVGRAELERELKHAFIAYSIEELLIIASKELAWCDEEMRKAAREMGKNSWKEAQEIVKSKFVKPGEQPKLINDLALEAIAYLEASNLVTIPAVAKETWRMRMMPPERQKMSPYFLGGPTIQVSYPTADMSHHDKLMSMRGNNPHFSRATVHHELIPGHHLQFFMMKRHKPYRQIFGNPFWLEGWAVYWEMLLWDLGFAKSPEDKIGMLFWRKHRCARIIFSLNYHTKQMSEQECIDFLVNRVGHEKNNATAEVRRSIMGGYGPLYQAAYMIGALQFRELHKEIIQTASMTNREFHDAILKENNIPVELLRAKLLKKEVVRDFKPSWRFNETE